MGLYMEPPTRDKFEWAEENLEHCNVLPNERPKDKFLVILIAFTHLPLWVIWNDSEFQRMRANMEDPSFERSTKWYYATREQLRLHCPGFAEGEKHCEV